MNEEIKKKILKKAQKAIDILEGIDWELMKYDDVDEDFVLHDHLDDAVSAITNFIDEFENI